MSSRELYLQGKAANKALHDLIDEKTRKLQEEVAKNSELQARNEALERELEILKGSRETERTVLEKLDSLEVFLGKAVESYAAFTLNRNKD